MTKITKEHLKNLFKYLGNAIEFGYSKEEVYKKLRSDFGEQDWNGYTKQELKDIGFMGWDEESGLLLAPPILLRMTKIGLELTSISEDTTKFNMEDNFYDVRFGATAYGVVKS